MWINVGIVPQDEEVIYLPESIAGNFKPEVSLYFGKKSEIAKVETSEDIEINGENKFENPLKIWLSSKLAAKLMIPMSLTYQMKFTSETIRIGPVIGLLLGGRNYLYSPRHMEKYSDRFGIYNQVGGLIYAFSPNTIDWKNLVAYGLYYNNKRSAWQYGRFPLPTVIYRRDFHSSPEITKKLIRVTNGRLFNAWRFTKFYLYSYIKRDKELYDYLPPTMLSTSFDSVKGFIDKYKSVILKPISLSRGRGICIIDKDGDLYRVSDYRARNPIDIELDGEEALKNFFDSNKVFFNRYIIQKRLRLAKIDGSPFDIRAVMQKEKPSEWKCTGIECRVAAKDSLLTNISRGGYALTIDEAIKRAFPQNADEHEGIKQQLDYICHKLCQSLDKTGRHFAELGLDIAIDDDMNLWIIEANVFPSFKGFKAMDYDTYLDIRHTPIFYAARLAGF